MLIVSREGGLPIGHLDIAITADDGTVLLSHSYKVPEEAELPTSVALVSNGSATARATISVTGWEVVAGQPDIPLDRRDAIVTQIPVDRVAELKVVLTARCTKWVDGSGQPTCQPSGYTCDSSTGDCVPPNVAASDLPTYDADQQGDAGSSAGGSSGVSTGGGAGGGTLNAGGADGGASSEGGSGGEGGSMDESGGAAVDGTSGGADNSSCGNGLLEGTAERCDDQNTLSGDGCGSTCQVETGWACTQSEPTVCDPACGDGLRLGDEARAGGCDDKNRQANDGCGATCKVETGYVCSGTPSVCAKGCGDGKLEANEGCDDGNDRVGDGCSACAVESGFRCDNTSAPSKCADVNECTSATPPCDANAICTNTSGSFSCKCAAGYSGTGKTCADIDECANNRPCSENAKCTNSAGSYSCACNVGYVGSGYVGGSGCARPSCGGMSKACQQDDCCASPTVDAGSFKLGGGSGTISANIAAFTLDRYEVTVARFRAFVNSYTGPPLAGAGAHPLIPGSGWQTAWDSNVPNQTTIVANVKCNATYQTWQEVGANDQLPMNCVSWYEAFAFCAWDNGRLPTEAEWEYAAAGGAEERVYPWGDTPVPDNGGGASGYVNYYGLGDGSIPGIFALSDILPVGSKAAGRGKYGQLDLAGSMYEWTLDWYANSYPINPCDNCANLSASSTRVVRGGSWGAQAFYLTAAGRSGIGPSGRSEQHGFRCARQTEPH